jgi:hypothetical protein
MNNTPDPTILTDLVSMRMPFGKFKGKLLCDLPEFYLAWFKRKGFPSGRLGVLLETMFEIRHNGLEGLLDKLKT